MGMIELSKNREVNEVLKHISSSEKISVEKLQDSVSNGRIAIMHNTNRPVHTARAVGEGLSTKVNANVGTSPLHFDVEEELEKVSIAIDAGADAVMDLSTGGDIPSIRRQIIEMSDVPIGTVPVYEALAPYMIGKKPIECMQPEEIFEVIIRQAEEGVDFMTLHCGVTKAIISTIEKFPRVMGVVSRGGSLLIEWMKKTGKENPLYSDFNKVLDILLKYDITISLGDGLRPGCLADSTDKSQLDELKVLGKLSERAVGAGVQAIVEGPGHIPVHEVAENIRLQKKYCNHAPFYVLGPIVTDIAPGYDHITSAIGGAIAASAGADFLCYVTRAEHLSLPTPEDVREGVIVARIAAHAGDVAKGIPGAAEWDYEYSLLRRKRDWTGQRDLVLDPERYDELLKRGKSDDVCSMCGDFCSLKTMERCGIKEKGNEQ